MLDPLLAASAPAHLPGVLRSLEPTLDRFGYLSLALIFLEDFGVPVPGETVLIVAAVYAGTGRLSIWLVALFAFVAAVAGDNLGFAIGHFGGRALVERFGKYIFLTPERLDKTTEFFNRHGGKVIVIARFVEGLRQANGIIAGTTGMDWKKFLPFNMLGAALWVALWVSVGYFSGSNIDTIYNTVTRYEKFFAIAVGVVILALIARHLWRRRSHREMGAQAEAGPLRGIRGAGEAHPDGEPRPANAAAAGRTHPDGDPAPTDPAAARRSHPDGEPGPTNAAAAGETHLDGEPGPTDAAAAGATHPDGEPRPTDPAAAGRTQPGGDPGPTDGAAAGRTHPGGEPGPRDPPVAGKAHPDGEPGPTDAAAAAERQPAEPDRRRGGP